MERKQKPETKQQGFAFQTLLSRAAKMNFAFPSPIFAFVLSARTDRQLFSRNPLPLPFAFPIFEFVFPPFDLRHEVQICLPVFRFYFRLDTFPSSKPPSSCSCSFHGPENVLSAGKFIHINLTI